MSHRRIDRPLSFSTWARYIDESYPHEQVDFKALVKHGVDNGAFHVEMDGRGQPVVNMRITDPRARGVWMDNANERAHIDWLCQLVESTKPLNLHHVKTGFVRLDHDECALDISHGWIDADDCRREKQEKEAMQEQKQTPPKEGRRRSFEYEDQPF